MKLASTVGKYARSIRDHGFVTTTGSYWNRLRERMQERHLGIRSGEIISLKELDLEHEERREYSPTQFHDFRCMEKFLRPKTSDEVFVDYGAGLGRMLILAATLPFRRVIGIEISTFAGRAGPREYLSLSTKTALQGYQSLSSVMPQLSKCQRTPPQFIFNNPFAGKILANVLDKIRFSYRATTALG